MVNDPISDFLTRVRNATLVSKSNVEIPHSNFKFELAKLFKDEGYISDVEVKGDGAKKVLNLTIKFSEEGKSVIDGLNRLSKPGRRVYSSFDKLPRNNGGLGTVVVSTSRGLLSDSEARKRKLGGTSFGKGKAGIHNPTPPPKKHIFWRGGLGEGYHVVSWAGVFVSLLYFS